MKPGLPLNIKIYLNISNPRSFRPSKLHVFLYNVDYACVFHYYYVNITNKIPQYFYNMSVTPNSFITGDRAVYKFNYITYMRATLAGDILEFKTSWKTKYVNNEAVPDKEGYYIIEAIATDGNKYTLSDTKLLFSADHKIFNIFMSDLHTFWDSCSSGSMKYAQLALRRRFEFTIIIII